LKIGIRHPLAMADLNELGNETEPFDVVIDRSRVIALLGFRDQQVVPRF
jgi:hypothetical protein